MIDYQIVGAKLTLRDASLAVAASGVLVAHMYFPPPDFGTTLSGAISYLGRGGGVGVVLGYFLLAMLYMGGYVAVLFGGYAALSNRTRVLLPFSFLCALLMTLFLPMSPNVHSTYTGAEVVFPLTLVSVLVLAKAGYAIVALLHPGNGE